MSSYEREQRSEPQKATAETDRHRAVHNTRHPRWHTVFHGRIYRPVMRVMHRWGWCYPESTLVDEQSVWCHWCGMRGSKSPPLYLALDVWMALGLPIPQFEPYVERNGWADTWAILMDAVRSTHQPQCPNAECVLSIGHNGPHYAEDDVGASEPLPFAADLNAHPKQLRRRRVELQEGDSS